MRGSIIDSSRLEALIHEVERLIASYRDGEFLTSFQSTGPRNTGLSDENSIFEPSLPDCVSDPRTKMLFLTPKGIKQVINRRARFDFSNFKLIYSRLSFICGFDRFLLATYFRDVSTF